MSPFRVRFAPSPTGYLHIGGLRTALYNYLFARKHGGTIILRIEDTDQRRFVEDAEKDILASLEWAGLDFDEGPGRDGGHGPYRQSERSDVYKQIAEELVDSGDAYIAFDTEEELTSMRERFATKENPNPRYGSSTRSQMQNALSLSEDDVSSRLESGQPYVIRLKVSPGGSVSFSDLIRGPVTFETVNVDDQVLMKSDGLPTYHLANIVDDHLMEVSHVIRGEEWLPSTPKHILLYEALGWDPPQMAHLPLILSPTGGKLSKRSAERAGIPVSVKEYRSTGYESGALINFLALLGWNPGNERELYAMEDLIEAFSLERVGQSGVQFDLNKLQWVNEHYLRQRSAKSIASDIKPLLAENGIKPDEDYLERVVAVMAERISLPSDLLRARYFFEDPTSYDDKTRKKRWKEESSGLVVSFAGKLDQLDVFEAATIETALRKLAEEQEVGAGRIIHPVRLAVSGIGFGPGLFELLELLGRETTVRRLRTAVSAIG
ncbi:MAG: glutamate--tRNA ligase [Rhodothermia bacterium]|nr:MAG: glutamate--tRNA ligase [Rhodothermia bacterium]